jgi:hypothetical protein
MMSEARGDARSALTRRDARVVWGVIVVAFVVLVQWRPDCLF